MKSTTSSLNDTIRTCIEDSRPLLNFDDVMWRAIFQYGSLTAANAREIGLVDHTPPVDPLASLLEVNRKEEREKRKKKMKEKSFASRFGEEDEGDEEEAGAAREKMEAKLGPHESLGKFDAIEAVSLVKYKQMLDKRARVERTREKCNDALRKIAETSTATSMILSALGCRPGEAPSKREKVAVVTVDGTIGSSTSYEVVRSLRQIRKDKAVKCVVLRVDSPGGSVVSSEAILEEIKLCDKVSARPMPQLLRAK